MRWRGDNYDLNRFDDLFLAPGQRFDLFLQGEGLRFDLRLDGFLPTYPLDGRVDGTPAGSTLFGRTCKTELQCYLQPMATVERVLLRWDHDALTLEAGDAYAVLGRGLALTFRKADLLGVDNALRGVHLRRDDGTWLVAGHAGLANAQNLDPTTLGVSPTPLDAAAGGEVARRFGANEDVEVGVHASALAFEETGAVERTWDRDVQVAGLRLSAPSLADGKVGAYLEGDVLRRGIRGHLTSDTETGHAIYGSLQWQGDRLTVLGEAVDYGNFVVARDTLEGLAARVYSSLPTLELQGLQRVRATYTRRGASVKADYAFDGTPWLASASLATLGVNEEQHGDPFDGLFVAHAWAQVRRFNPAGNTGGRAWTFEALAGARRETFLHDPIERDVTTGDMDRLAFHGELGGSFASGADSIEAKLEHRLETEHRLGGYVDFVRGGLNVTYTRALKFSLSPAVRWNTERADLLKKREGSLLAFLGPGAFPAVEARWNFTPENFVSLFAGSTPAGRLCSGGVCRDVPAFEGLALQLVLRR